MSLMPMLEVAIALGFFYALLSLVCSSVTEGVSTFISLRARGLCNAVGRMLDEDDDGALAKEVLNHPLIKSFGPHRLWKGVSRVPDYLPSSAFARALLDVLHGAVRPKGKPSESLGALDEIVDGIPFQNLKKSLRSVLPGAKDIDAARASIETWYDNAMDAARSWYSRRVGWINLGAAALIVLALNADTLMMTDALWRNGNLRAAIVAQAEVAVEDQEKPAVELTGLEASELLQNFPLGWNWGGDAATTANAGGDGNRRGSIWLKIVGLLVTTIAVSLGAPFWFDLLNRLVNLRSGGKPLPTASDKDRAVSKAS